MKTTNNKIIVRPEEKVREYYKENKYPSQIN